MANKQPKFAIGDLVALKSGHYKNQSGTIEVIERRYQAVDDNGHFVPDGLVTLESTISSISLPHEFDGETLTVHYPEHDYGTWIEKAHSRVAKFNGYSYTIRIHGLGYLVSAPERSLKGGVTIVIN